MKLNMKYIFICFLIFYFENRYDWCWGSTIDQCGKVKSRASSRISNAKEATEYYPWVIAVFREYKGQTIGKCGGVIINER